MNIKNAHDKFFKSIMKNQETAIDFFRSFLPATILQKVDIQSIVSTDVSFIDPKLKEHFSDLVFKIRLKDKEESCYISIILEHKSYIDNNTAIQLLFYMASSYLQMANSKLKLEVNIPFLFYHGKDRWEYKPLHHLFKHVPKEFQKFVPVFDTLYVDLSNLDEERLQQFDNLFLTAVLMFQKFRYQPNFLTQRIHDVLNLLDAERDRNQLHTFFVYFINLFDLSSHSIQNLIDMIPSSLKPEFKSAYEAILNEGVEKGIEIGVGKGIEIGVGKGIEKEKINTIIRGYEKGFNLESLASISNLSIDAVKEIIHNHHQDRRSHRLQD